MSGKWVCDSCEQPLGSLHLDECPHRRPFGGGFVSIVQATKQQDNPKENEK